MFILEKLVSREVGYQIVSYGITKTLNESNKKIWPTFPIKFGIFSLVNYWHDEKEILAIQVLNLPIVPNR